LACADICRYETLGRPGSRDYPASAGAVLIDLGCGTGRFTVRLAEQLEVSVIGVDPSKKMLREAKQITSSPQVEYREGAAESIPLDANSAALIFISNAIHHVESFDEAVREMVRVLQPDGVVFVRNYSFENLESLHYMQFFPEAMQISREMIWPRSAFVQNFTATGFAKLSQGTVHQQASPDFDCYIRK
jgi:ubiquinone/menaquinone biosynthesis C-methylase UbiE